MISYKCPLCGRLFNTLSGTKYHVRRVHSPRICPACGAEFPDATRLALHAARLAAEGDEEHMLVAYLCGKFPRRAWRELARTRLAVLDHDGGEDGEADK